MQNDWPDCPVEGCAYKICLSLQSDRCYPHTPGTDEVKDAMIKEHRATMEQEAMHQLGFRSDEEVERYTKAVNPFFDEIEDEF